MLSKQRDSARIIVLLLCYEPKVVETRYGCIDRALFKPVAPSPYF